MNVLGIDIGGSGIRGAVVDTVTGQLLTPIERVSNDRQATPSALVEAVRTIARSFRWDGAVGVGFPGLLHGGTVRAALNLHPDFRGLDLRASLRVTLNPHVALVNDADAAGLAEVVYGAGRGIAGSVLVVTFGTGIGSGQLWTPARWRDVH